MDPQPPEAKRIESPQAPPVAPPGVGSRPYPKPPRLLKRLLLLCLKPEAWPAAAKYPLWVTLIPLILAILIAVAAFTATTAINALHSFDAFAKSYDTHYPELDLNSDGILSVKDPTHEPLEFNASQPRIIVDTTGKTSLSSIKDPYVFLITSHQFFRRAEGHDFDPIEIKDGAALLLPEKGGITRINGTTLQHFLTTRRPEVFTTLALLLGIIKLFTESLWVAVTMFLIFPAVTIGASIGATRLFIPKRAAYRIAAAVLIPLVLLSGLTAAAGYPASAVVGPENSLIFWFFAAAALAFWSGYMAKKMFIPKSPRRRTI